MNRRVLTMICLKIILIFYYLVLWQKKLYETKDKTKNNELVEKIKNRWSDLKDKIKKMSEEEKEAEKTVKILEIVEEILIPDRENQKQ